MDDQPTFRQRDVRRRFDRAAQGFDSADFVHAATRSGLLSRLEPLLVKAHDILDLGAATGSSGDALRKRFRGAHVVSLDLSHEMLRRCVSKRRWFSRPAAVQADAARLPFAARSFDVVFANMLLPWIDRPARVFAEVSRVLRDGGVFAFATLGPDSLLEIARAWSQVDGLEHVQRFPDMHDIGDALIRAGIADPVLDVDHLTVEYSDVGRLFEDLTRSGARNTLRDRPPAMLGKRRLAKFREALKRQGRDDIVRLELELVYGHGWGRGRENSPGDFRIDASSIALRRTDRR